MKFFVVAIVCSSTLAHAAPVLESRLSEIVRTVAEEEIAARPLAGLVVGVRHGGETWSAAYGLADVERGTPVTVLSEFRVASITKTLTAASVWMLIEDPSAKVSLDDDIRKHVPTFPKKSHVVTVRHLLGNLSGVSNYRNCARECHDKEPKTTEQALAVFSSWQLESKPGERYVYSTYGFNLLGALVERVSKTPYDTFLRERLGPRAGLVATRVDRGPRGPLRVKGHRLKEGVLVASEYVDVTGRFAGGGAVSTVPDLVRFGGAFVDGRVVSLEAVRTMSTSQATADGRLTKYGMGLASYPLAGRQVIGHAGGQPETSSLLLMYPGHDLVVAVVTNTEDQWPALYVVAGRIAEEIFFDGLRRRGVVARALTDTLFVEALSSSFNYGMAAYEMEGGPQSFGEALRASGATNVLLNRARDGDDVTALSRDLSLAVGPNDGAPLTAYGAFAAGVIASAFGKDVLEEQHRAGPLAFFTRFVEACARIDCPVGLRLGKENRVRLTQLDEAFRRAASDHVLHARVGRATDLEALATLLERARALDAYPDFGEDLVDESARARASLDVPRAERALALAQALAPHSGKVHCAIGERALEDGALEAARASLERCAALPGAHERFGSERAIPIGKRIARGAAGHDGAAVFLDVAARTMGTQAELYDALAAAHAKRKDAEAARKAKEAARAIRARR